MKTFVYVYNTALLVLGINMEDLKPCQPSRVVSVCIVIGGFTNFLVDPYYEPIPWFMIHNIS